MSDSAAVPQRSLSVPAAGATVDADLALPDKPRGLVLFAHGSGSSRHSPRNRQVAAALRQAGLGTVLADLLTPQEEEVDLRTRHLRFDVDLLADRLVDITEWLQSHAHTAGLAVGLFGASTGAAAALKAAARHPGAYRAVVSRGGRPDLAGSDLSAVEVPTLLVVGSRDRTVLALNQEALARLGGEKRLEVVAGASHLFEEPGALDEVARLAADWFVGHVAGGTAVDARG